MPEGVLSSGTPWKRHPVLTSTEFLTCPPGPLRTLQFLLSLPPWPHPSPLPGVVPQPSFGLLTILSSPAGQACLDSKEVGASSA